MAALDQYEPPGMGVDIGGGKIRAMTNASELDQPHVVCPTPANADELIALIAELYARWHGPGYLGVGVPGVFDARRGVVRRAVNLPWLENFPLRARLEGILRARRPLVIESDVNAATWAQWNACEGPRRFAYLAIGTGVGGGVTIDGEIIRHTNGGAGHFGFLLTDPRLEAPALPGDAPGSLSACVAAFCRGQRDVTTRTYAARAIAIGAAQISRIYDLDTVAIGGGALDHDVELFPEIQRQGPIWRGGVVGCAYEIRRAPLSSDIAGASGAMELARQAWHMSLRPRRPRQGRQGGFIT